MECRKGCGACCIAPSINRPIPGMPEGKPAGVRCIHLDEKQLCRLFGQTRRPALCAKFKAEPEVCGDNFGQAMECITALELATQECSA